MSDDTSENQGIISILEFLQQYDRLIISLNPYNCHTLLEIYESQNQQENYSICFWIPPLLTDILRLKRPEQGKRVSIYQLKPGHYYHLASFFHEWSILYLSTDQIYLVEFYMETGRLTSFQVKRFTNKMLKDYLTALVRNDIESFSYFHEGDKSHRQGLYEIKSHLNNNFMLIDNIYEQPLNYNVGLDDVFRVLLRRSPLLEWADVYDYTEDDFEDKPPEALIQARKYYEENRKALYAIYDSYKSKKVKYATLAI